MYPQPMYQPPVPRPSTRTLTTVKWITVAVSLLLTAAGVFWIKFLYNNVAFLEHYKYVADWGDRDPDDAIARAERNVLIGYATVASFVLLGVFALVAGAGQRWARAFTAVLMLGPIGVIVWGALDGGSRSTWAFSLVTPFVVLAVLWCLPGVSRGIAAKRPRNHAMYVG